MNTKVKISLISSSAIVIAALIGVVNYNVGERNGQTSSNTPSMNVVIDHSVLAGNVNIVDSHLGNESLTRDIITETYDISELETASSLKVTVRDYGDDNMAWGDTVDVEEGKEIEFQIEYTNTNQFDQKDIVISDILPENVKYIQNTARKYDSQNPNGIYINSDEFFSERGFNVGSYGPNANFNLRFRVEVVDVGLMDGIRTLNNMVQCQIGTEERTVTDNYASVILAGWGPERPLYSLQETADHAVFNSMTDNPAIGDERDFVRIAEKNG